MNMKKIIYLTLIACSAIFLSCKEDSGMTKDGDLSWKQSQESVRWS